MAHLSQTQPAVSPQLIAGLLLAALEHLAALGLPCPTATHVLDALDVGRTQAYAQRSRVQQVLLGLLRPPGRPPAPPPAPPSAGTQPLTLEVLRFVLAHPGCAAAGAARQHYSDAFRRFILELRARHPELELETFAAATAVPAGTIEDWLRVPPPAPPPPPQTPTATIPRLEALIEGWNNWTGSFVAFCKHAQENLHVPHGATWIASVLQAAGVRTPKQRQGRSPDEEALRKAFQTFFPGAQWIGDGTPIELSINGKCFRFNLELMVDAHSGARTGMSIRDEEDATAVVEAVKDGVETTGAPPFAVLLDNRPSNHAPEVVDGLAAAGDVLKTTAVVEAAKDAGDVLKTTDVVETVNDADQATAPPPPAAVLIDNCPSNHSTDVVEGLAAADAVLKMRATKGRPQNKGHVEGSFGLFRQTAPELAINAQNERELAREVLRLVATTWGRATNHVPRNDREKKSRVQIYQESKPTPEQVEQAKQALRERHRQQELQEERRRARLDPVTRKLLDDAFTELGLADPDEHFRNAIARYPLDAVVAGIATFRGKRSAGRLPEGVDARYLLGIVRNISQEREGIAIGQELLRLRLAARDAALVPLVIERAAMLQEPGDVLNRLVDRAMSSDRHLDRLFWFEAAGDVIRSRPLELRANLIRGALRRIHTTHRVPFAQRLAAVRLLQEAAIPIDAELTSGTARRATAPSSTADRA